MGVYRHKDFSVKPKEVIQQRLDEISNDLRRLCNQPTESLSEKQVAHIRRLTDEGLDLEGQLALHKKATSMASYASPSEWGMAGTNPGDDSGIAFKGFGPGMENRIRPTSMYEIDKSQINALQQAARQGTPFKVQVGSKGIEHGFMGGVRDKSAVTEGGLTPNLLPPIQQYGAMGYWGLPYELTRVQNWLPNVAMDGPGVAYFQHTANAAEAAYTAEGATKPDLTPTVKEQYIRPSKVSGRILLTHELVQDAGDAFAQNLVSDLARSLYNATSALLLNGTTAGNGWPGINQVTGTLTRAAAIGSGDIDALDTLSKAFVDLRSDFFVPDLCFVHPSTMGALRRLRDLNNRLQLELLSGAGAINGTSEQETLWGVPVVQTTQQAAGTAAVLSVQSGAAVVYVREALTVFYDPYSMASSNVYQHIAEQRLALATPRPGAINLVSGLPTS
jgi:Phage capsid family